VVGSTVQRTVTALRNDGCGGQQQDADLASSPLAFGTQPPPGDGTGALQICRHGTGVYPAVERPLARGPDAAIADIRRARAPVLADVRSSPARPRSVKVLIVPSVTIAFDDRTRVISDRLAREQSSDGARIFAWRARGGSVALRPEKCARLLHRCADQRCAR
jgi:hypothetical protein